MQEAWKSQCGRYQMQIGELTQENKKYEQLKLKFLEQIEMMKVNAKSLRDQVAHHKGRSEEKEKQLLNFQI